MSAEGLPELYVYYKVAEAQAEAALQAFERASLGLAGLRLLRSELAQSGPQTWMEIHAGEQAQASELLLAVAMTPYISGARHIERFLALR